MDRDSKCDIHSTSKKAPWLRDDARLQQLWGSSNTAPSVPAKSSNPSALLAYVLSAPLRPPRVPPSPRTEAPSDHAPAKAIVDEPEAASVSVPSADDEPHRIADRDLLIGKLRQGQSLCGHDGATFIDWLRKRGHEAVKSIPDAALHLLLDEWQSQEGKNGQRVPKRARDASAPSPVKIARKEHRHRYAISELISLRHTQRLESVNAYAISKHAAEQVTHVQTSDDFADDNGNLRTTDVLIPITEANAPPTFADMRLPPSVVTGLRASGFERPSPVQYKGIPVARLGVDVIAQAKSGTGKTIVFAAVIAEIALQAAPGRVCALVLVPTREIARQVAAVIADVLGPARGGNENAMVCEVAVLVGGKPEWKDGMLLKKATVAVGTPARVHACLVSGVLDVTGLRLLVLDEADRLLDPGADLGLGAAVARLPAARQTAAFSATYTPALVARLRAIMREPQLVWLGAARSEDDGDALAVWRAAVLRGVRQWRLDVCGDKGDALLRVLRARTFNACLAFAGTRDGAMGYAKLLRTAGFKARHVSAALCDAARREAVREFENGAVKVLVGTDLMARGVSFDRCDMVVQIDVPDDCATYLHRVGRAGRFGGRGEAVVLVGKADVLGLRGIEARIGRLLSWPFGDTGGKEDGEKDDWDKEAGGNGGCGEEVAADRNGSCGKEVVADRNDSCDEEVVAGVKEGGCETRMEITDMGKAAVTAAREAGMKSGYEAARKLIERIEAYRKK